MCVLPLEWRFEVCLWVDDGFDRGPEACIYRGLKCLHWRLVCVVLCTWSQCSFKMALHAGYFSLYGSHISSDTSMTDRFLGCFSQKTLCVKMPYISIHVTRGEPCMPCMRSDLSHANVIGINQEGCVHPVACTCVMCAAWWEWNCLLVKHSIVGKYVYVVWWSVLVIPTCKKWRWL
jgi:hypothetical protein